MTHDLEKKDDGLLIRARALCGAGRLAWYELDLAAARAHLEEGLAIFRRAGDPAGTLDALSSVIMVLSWQGEDAAALALVQEGMSLLRQIEDRQKQLPILSNFGWAVAFTCSPETLDDSWSINQEVAILARAAGDKRSLAWALNGLGLCCYWAMLSTALAGLPALPRANRRGREW